MTANAFKEDERAAEQAGMQAHITTSPWTYPG